MEEKRNNSIDNLKAICTFLIVCIHVPFPGEIGAYFITLTRIAGPIFFMITGFFYLDVIFYHKEVKQIKKILKLLIEANVFFLIWNILCKVLGGKNIIHYLQSTITLKNIIKFVVFNESPLGIHLWYLGAVFYVLLIVFFLDKLKRRKILYSLIPFLLIIDLVFGKYSLIIFHHEFPYILVRNFLCVGIPYFCIGNIIRERKYAEKCNKRILQIMIIVFAISSFLERFILVKAGANATRDHYISTTFLAISFFVYALKSNWNNEILALIGRRYSTWLYIMHPIFITLLSMVAGKFGVKSIYRCVAPIVVYCVTLVFLIVLQKVKIVTKSK